MLWNLNQVGDVIPVGQLLDIGSGDPTLHLSDTDWPKGGITYIIF